MNLHQVLTGAVNPGDNCFSLGSIGERPFTNLSSTQKILEIIHLRDHQDNVSVTSYTSHIHRISPKRHTESDHPGTTIYKFVIKPSKLEKDIIDEKNCSVDLLQTLLPSD